jgi:twitching motility two-component system response regulator PilH
VGILDTFRSLFANTAAEAVSIEPVQVIANERRGRRRLNARPGTRALIIDDSRTIVVALRRMLQSAGYMTMEALDAESGLELARTRRPELIFLDIILPGMNGFAALRALRRDPLTQRIPVIMMSGNEQATEQFFGSRIGADDFMKKPFSRMEVFARVERLLDAQMVPCRPGPSPSGDMLQPSAASPAGR